VTGLGRTVAVCLLLGCAGLFEPTDALDPGRTQDVGLPVLSHLWKRVLHDRTEEHRPQEFASAAAGPSLVYVGSHAGILYGLSISDGSIVWKRKLGPVSSQPLLLEGRLYVGTDDGAMFALDAGSGAVRWKFVTKGAILHPPAVVGDMVIFANDADHVYALDRDSGKWRWQYDRETPEEFTMRGHAGVVAHGEHVFAGFSDGHVVALTSQSGDVVWVRSLAGSESQFVDVDSTPAVDATSLYAASASGGLYALDLADGTERWRFDVKGAGSVALDGQRVYFAAADEGLFALDRRGHLLWRQGLRQGGDPAAPLIQGPYLFLSLSDRGLMVVDRATGRLYQSFDPGPGISSPPTVAGERLYLLSNGGILYAMTLTEY
jgi:outer membrane protein assembly factor BamB